ncbi:MAG: RluA family pseudouridine synthase [Muribaculaceae bacterium]|nr:RluA family pseudouridine synthase [Muribaculaceae bacterium]
MQVLYEDNHIIIVNKEPGEIVQGDKTGDRPLSDTVAAWLKEKYAKPGNVFVGVTHRLDRPVGGVVVFAKTSKALSRMNEMFRTGAVHKRYWAITAGRPPQPEGELHHYITTVERTNKSYARDTPRPGAKEARLRYRQIAEGERYRLLEIELLTGRKHQIRVQLSSIGCPIKGDLKYGAPRSNPDGSISLLAREISFTHPVSGKDIHVVAPAPADPLWQAIASQVARDAE